MSVRLEDLKEADCHHEWKRVLRLAIIAVRCRCASLIGPILALLYNALLIRAFYTCDHRLPFFFFFPPAPAPPGVCAAAGVPALSLPSIGSSPSAPGVPALIGVPARSIPAGTGIEGRGFGLTLAICESSRRFRASNLLRTMDENVLYMMH